MAVRSLADESVAVRARSPSALLRAGSRPAGESAGLRDDAGGDADGGVRPTQTNFKSGGRGRPPYTNQLQEQRTGASALHRPTSRAADGGVRPTQTNFKSSGRGRPPYANQLQEPRTRVSAPHKLSSRAAERACLSCRSLEQSRRVAEGSIGRAQSPVRRARPPFKIPLASDCP